MADSETTKNPQIELAEVDDFFTSATSSDKVIDIAGDDQKGNLSPISRSSNHKFHNGHMTLASDDHSLDISRSNVLTTSEIEDYQVAEDETNYEIQKVKYENKPCLRLLFGACGWLLLIFSLFIIFLSLIVFGPFIFIGIKSRFIAKNIIWESLINYTLTKEDALYVLKGFPYPFLLKHAGASYIRPNNIMVILKIIYVIPQAFIFGPFTAFWIVYANYQLIKKENAGTTQLHCFVKFVQYLFATPIGRTARRTFSSFFFVFDVSTDIYIMIQLYESDDSYWFSLTFGSLLCAYFVPWARSITFVKEYIVKKKSDALSKKVIRCFAALFLIPWFGIFAIVFFDIYLILNILFDWMRLLFFGQVRTESEEEISYRRLRTLTELMCESIPQLIIQYYILRTSQDEEQIKELGLSELDLYRSMAASSMNLSIQIISLYFESQNLKNKSAGLQNMSFFQYMFISMEGRFSFSTKLLSIESGANCDLSNVSFTSDPYILTNFFQATSNAHRAMMKKNKNHTSMCQKITISPQTVSGLENEMILRLTRHCRKNNVQLTIKCEWDQWYRSQRSFDYCIDVQHEKEDPYHTALTFAISKDGYDAMDYVRRLLLSSVDVNKPNKETDSPLLLSVVLTKYEYADMLLKNGARINEVNSQNKTALFHALAKRDLNLIKILLDYDVDVFVQENEFGNTAFLETAWTQFELVELILHHPNVKKQELKKGKKLVNVGNNKGETMLFKAANFGLLNIVQICVECGADIEYEIEEGLTVLFKCRTKQIIKYLIEAGASVTVTNKKGQTPIFGCIYMRLYTLLLLYNELVEERDMNHRDFEGNTVFHYLAIAGEWEFLASLVKHSNFSYIDIHSKNQKGESIQDMVIEARKHGNQKAIDYFDAFKTKEE